MLNCPMDLPDQFPVRKTKSQKQAFRDAVQAYAEALGYCVSVEAGRFGSRNIILGDPERAAYLITAHYDTPAASRLPNRCVPCSLSAYVLRALASWLWIFSIGTVFGVSAALLLGERIIPAAAFVSVFGALVLRRIGPANVSNMNDNTSGLVTLLEIARTLPENQRHKVCFVLFDLEEAGLIGSGSHRRMHREATQSQLVLNLDCVGDGDHIRMFPTKKLRADRRRCTSLYAACGYFGSKEILVHEKGWYRYNSDQRSFPYGVGICALNRRKKKLYFSRIHTPKDTVLDINNVNLLRAALTTFICRDAVNLERKNENETL